MSDVDTALTGADEVAPVVAETTQAPEPTTENVDPPKPEQPRDETGKFVPQARVNEITRARRDAERRADALERELAQYRQPPQPQVNTRPPLLSEYQNDPNAWSQAVALHAAQQAQQAVEQQYRQRDEQQHRVSMERQFEERSRAYAADHPDFEQTLDALSSAITFRPEIVEAIGLSDHGPAVVDYLGKHLDEADRISRLPPHLAAVHLGRIEAQVSAPRTKPVSNAPAPAPVLGGGSAIPKDPERMSTDEWLKWRRGQLNAK